MCKTLVNFKFSRFRQAGVKITLFMSCRAGRRLSDLHAIYVSRCLYVHWQSRLGVIWCNDTGLYGVNIRILMLKIDLRGEFIT